MEPSPGSPSSANPHQSHLVQPPRTTSAASTYEHGSSDRKAGDSLRRGHSDGDMLTGGFNGRSGISTEPASADRETWMDFIRQPPSARQEPVNRAQMAASRAAIMASDRRRRLAEHHDDYTRRRSSSSLSYVYPGSNHPRQSFTEMTDEGPSMGPSMGPSSTSNSPPMQRTQGSRERPLPRPPSIETLQNRRSRDIALPRWQPDAEVSKCPICGNAFTMWYRRHHCRKCGRVVCASCSPHRITIPRQFIVHPPEDATPSPTMATNPGMQIVDLTGEGNDIERGSSSDRPQSSDYRIDPALGGGQEVRLCNPCVPDPNPSPHLPYPSPHALPNPHHATRLDTMSAQHRLSAPGIDRSNDDQRSTLTRRISSVRSDYHPPDAARFDASLASINRATSRRHSHAPNSLSSPMSPPGYSSLYGSAPDQTAHQRHVQALLQSHPSHRHHASMGNVPSSSHYRPMPNFDASISRPAPQPQLREEDICPICHHALPPKGPNGSELAREAHINSCIERAFASSGPGSSHAPSPQAAGAASATASAQGPGTRPIPAGHRDSAGSNDVPSGSFQPRRAGMVVYPASEKDCVGKDGEGTQECVICFEEFAVGDELGRLECWCKFHKACIRQWWESSTKGPGSCPVHQQGT